MAWLPLVISGLCAHTDMALILRLHPMSKSAQPSLLFTRMRSTKHSSWAEAEYVKYVQKGSNATWAEKEGGDEGKRTKLPQIGRAHV